MGKHNRIIWIDRMRGIAILSVVMEHLTIGQISNDFVYIKWIALANMAVFFFISSYLMDLTAKLQCTNDVLRFILKRTAQLMIPFFVWPLIIRKYAFTANWAPITIEDFINEIYNPHLWFLMTLYVYSLLFLIYKLFDNKKQTLLGILFLLIVISILNILYLKYGLLKNVALYSWVLILGVLVSRFNLIDSFRNKYVLALSFFFTIFTLAFWTSGHTSIINVITKIEVSIATISLLFYLCTNFQWNILLDKLITKFGFYSLSIYVIHWTFLTIFQPPIQFINNELAAFGFVLIVGIIISYVSVLIYQFLKDLPIVRFVLFGEYSIIKK